MSKIQGILSLHGFSKTSWTSYPVHVFGFVQVHRLEEIYKCDKFSPESSVLKNSDRPVTGTPYWPAALRNLSMFSICLNGMLFVLTLVIEPALSAFMALI